MQGILLSPLCFLGTVRVFVLLLVLVVLIFSLGILGRCLRLGDRSIFELLRVTLVTLNWRFARYNLRNLVPVFFLLLLLI
jgi:hypothetical protein